MKQTVEEAAREYSSQWAWNSQPNMKHEYPAYTLQDILDKLPKRIETEDYEFELYIYYHENGVSVFYDDGDITQLAFFSKPTLLESAYEMLCWCIEKGYIKTN